MMGADHDLIRRYKEVCADLNLDKAAADEAWLSFQRIGVNYTLEVCFHPIIHLILNMATDFPPVDMTPE